MSALPDTWRGSLALAFSRQASGRTVLASRRHEGPLLVQKALYPEGPEVCHVTLLHPPSGIAGGDELNIHVQVGSGAHALLTTPGATRWYKANGRGAAQHVCMQVAAGARLEWLPQENLYFEQADAWVDNRIEIASGAAAIGWEVHQLGSIEKTTHWDDGRLLLTSTLSVDGTPLWLEAGELAAHDALRHAQIGLAGLPVLGTLWAYGRVMGTAQDECVTQSLPWTDTLRAGLTHLRHGEEDGLMLVRVLGVHAQDVRQLLVELWSRLRPTVLGTPAVPLRLWNT
ncbi:MAG TPA: urease accessory protein UreD [Burkholderiaceae bacterium]|jgi:urease accessory protein|nr:urease accessory protein UreD [Burkholderiaceae bacterium]